MAYVRTPQWANLDGFIPFSILTLSCPYVQGAEPTSHQKEGSGKLKENARETAEQVFLTFWQVTFKGFQNQETPKRTSPILD